jgi:hypothetical protein
MRLVAGCFFLVLNIGCATTQLTYVTRANGQEQLVIESEQGLPAATGDFTYSEGVVRGHVAWTYDCRRAVVSKGITETVETRKPNHVAAVGAIALGVIAGALSGALLSEADGFSDVDECSTDGDGHYSCRSPRDDATVLGAAGMLSSVFLIGAGVGTLGMKTSSRVTDSQPAAPMVLSVDKQNVACGTSPIQNLGLALVRANTRVAFSATNALGEVAFAVPANVTGDLLVLVDSVPPPITAIHTGDVVGTVQVSPSVSIDKLAQGRLLQM